MKLLLILLLLGAGACAYSPLPEPPLTQLQTREIQTREYDTSDTRLVMKAVLNVLQDEGFIAKDASYELGLIRAEKEVDLENRSNSLFRSFVLGSEALWVKSSLLEASANVSEYGRQTRVRVNFHRKVFDNRGGVVSTEQVLVPEFYQDFFSKVDKGIFIQKQRI